MPFDTGTTEGTTAGATEGTTAGTTTSGAKGAKGAFTAGFPIFASPLFTGACASTAAVIGAPIARVGVAPVARVAKRLGVLAHKNVQ